jgi:hypothetical protein
MKQNRIPHMTTTLLKRRRIESPRTIHRDCRLMDYASVVFLRHIISIHMGFNLLKMFMLSRICTWKWKQESFLPFSATMEQVRPR